MLFLLTILAIILVSTSALQQAGSLCKTSAYNFQTARK